MQPFNTDDHEYKLTDQPGGPYVRFSAAPMTRFSVFSLLALPYHNQMSQYQLSYILKLMLGLPLPAPDSASQNMCHCNHPFTPDGTHQLCCREWAARGWTAGHDRVVDAIA